MDIFTTVEGTEASASSYGQYVFAASKKPDTEVLLRPDDEELVSAANVTKLIRLEVSHGNIFIWKGQQRRQLTRSGRDSEPVLSPDQQSIVYTRFGGPGATESDENCKSGTQADELRRIFIDGSGDEMLMRGRTGPERYDNVCNFSGKQFTSDGRKVFFIAPGWVTSGALHTYDIVSRSHRYVMPANGVIVLDSCPKVEYRDNLVVLQHRYFMRGGSYDWWWLFDRTGKQELNAVGDFDGDPATLKSELTDWLCRP